MPAPSRRRSRVWAVVAVVVMAVAAIAAGIGTASAATNPHLETRVRVLNPTVEARVKITPMSFPSMRRGPPVSALEVVVDACVAPRAASGGAENVANLGRLNKQLASVSQMAAPGKSFAGAGTTKPLRAADRLASQYGGEAADWAKMSSGNYNSGSGGIYDLFETHWYENVKTGPQAEFKTKFPWAEAEFNKP